MGRSLSGWENIIWSSSQLLLLRYSSLGYESTAVAEGEWKSGINSRSLSLSLPEGTPSGEEIRKLIIAAAEEGGGGS